MVLMTVDHAGSIYDAHHLHGDAAHGWIAGSPLPAGEFLTRWVTHLCAPTFVLLAGVSLALSVDKRGDRPGQTAFLVRRGLVIAALDPLWMSLGFGASRVILQVLYAIGLSMVCMAFLRKLPSWALLAGAVAIQLGGEWIGARFPQPYPDGVHFDATVWTRAPVRYLVGALLFNGGPMLPRIRSSCAYPLVPWLSIMMAGWVLGRWLIATRERPRAHQARTLGALGVALLVVFAVVRGADGYGNWGLHRDSLAALQWLHVAKYPPSLSFTALELGLALSLLALFVAVDDGRPRPWLRPLSLFGGTAFFYYLLHIHLLAASSLLLRLDRQQHGLLKTWVAAAVVLLALAPLCARYRRYKAAHTDGWTRYI